jgi:hypothetical protein
MIRIIVVRMKRLGKINVLNEVLINAEMMERMILSCIMLGVTWGCLVMFHYIHNFIN